jgi:hypothetical protein
VQSVLFPLGVRLSTWVALAVFLTLGLRDRRFWLAAAVWLVGFETLFELTSTVELLAHRPIGASAWWALAVDFVAYALGGAFVYWAARRGILPSPLLVGVACVVWAAWIATGFHRNPHTLAGFDPTAEALNEGVKTIWALAYLLPLWWASRSRGGRNAEIGAVGPAVTSSSLDLRATAAATPWRAGRASTRTGSAAPRA